MTSRLAPSLLPRTTEVTWGNLPANHLESLPDPFHRIAGGTRHARHGNVPVDPHRAEGTVGMLGIAAHIEDDRPRRQVLAVVPRNEHTGSKRFPPSHETPTGQAMSLPAAPLWTHRQAGKFA